MNEKHFGSDPLKYGPSHAKGRPEASVNKGDSQVYPASQEPGMGHKGIMSHESGTHPGHGHGYNPGKKHHKG